MSTMIFLESSARVWLILHAILGAATVAVATHLVVWIRRYPRGDFARHAAARWFATTALCLYAAQFTVGNLIYPVYKVRVRAEKFDAAEPPTGPRLARTFDVKEHWVVLGLGMSIALCGLAWGWDPRRDGAGAVHVFMGLATGVALCAWLAAIIGLWVTSYRSVGGPTA